MNAQTYHLNNLGELGPVSDRARWWHGQETGHSPEILRSYTQTMNQSQPMAKADRFRFLRRAIRGNGVFSLVGGMAFLVGARLLAEFTGIPWPLALTITGIVLMVYGADLLWVASKPEIDRKLAWTAVILDIVWVAASYDVLFFNLLPLTIGGKWTVVLLAEVVSVFAIWQYIGLRRSR